MKTLLTSYLRASAVTAASRQYLKSTLIVSCVLTLLSLGSARAADFRAFPIPSGSQPIAITRGADGNFWFTMQNSSQVGRVTPRGQVTEFVTPTLSFPNDITPGPDGNVWFSEGAGSNIASITPDGVITEVNFSNFDVSGGIVTGPDGNIWFTDLTGNNIWRYDLTTKSLTKFPIPTADSFPSDIAVGSDGNLWFTEQSGGNVARITTSGVITEFGGGALNSPRSIVDGPDGNLWFSLAFDPMIVRMTTTGTMTFFPLPNRAEGIARGHQNNILFTEFSANKIASITTDGVVTESGEFVHSAPTGITAGPGKTVWFLGYGTNRVYRTNVPR